MTPRIRVKSVEILSQGWSVLKRTILDYRRADGTWQTLARETYDRGNGATILLYDPDRKTVLLIRQFRFPAFAAGHPGFLVETCGGVLEGDDPATCIAREVEEETGYRIRDPQRVFDAFMSPGAVTERLTFFIARYAPTDRIGPGGGLAEEGEEIELLEPTLDEALAMIEAGEIVDAKTIMLLQYAKLHRLME
ncbi:MAG TPA: NUDIX domain-containing protein [Acetobacteraceae bacterium]|nr:NUDIX domain-containing protein [Acetobacteraceae bacterium]